MNADGRADIVCMADGGVMVWESRKENTNIYDSSSKWKDDKFGFCEFQNKQVQLLFSQCCNQFSFVYKLFTFYYYNLNELKRNQAIMYINFISIE